MYPRKHRTDTQRFLFNSTIFSLSLSFQVNCFFYIQFTFFADVFLNCVNKFLFSMWKKIQSIQTSVLHCRINWCRFFLANFLFEFSETWNDNYLNERNKWMNEWKIIMVWEFHTDASDSRWIFNQQTTIYIRVNGKNSIRICQSFSVCLFSIRKRKRSIIMFEKTKKKQQKKWKD